MTGRRLPGRAFPCSTCGAEIVFARTLASPTGRGGKAMPLDADANPDGNVAVRATGSHGPVVLVARVLGKDDTIDRTVEVLAMPHFATCRPPETPDTPPEQVRSNVIPFPTRRTRK